MASDPERPIEKLLRACAEKRREEAGGPLEVHPATRRLLLGEVERQFGKPASQATAAPGGHGRFWPRLAWSLAGAGALAVLVLVLVPGREQAPKTLAKNELAALPAATAFPEPASAKAVAPPPVAVTEQAARRESLMLDVVSPAAAEKAKQPGSNQNAAAVAFASAESEAPQSASSPVAGTAPALPAAVPPSGALAESAGKKLESGALGQQMREIPGAPALAGQSQRLTLQTTDALVQNTWNFVQTAEPAFKERKDTSATAPLLANFEVRQTGPNLEIIDRDGSVYSGYWRNTPIVSRYGAGTGGARFTRALGAAQSAAPAAVGGVVASSSAANSETTSNYFFRVAGTNLTLNRQVVFTGNFWVPTDNNGTNQVAQPVGGVLQNVPDANLPLLNSRISGKALLGGQEFDINALQEKR